MGSPFYAEYAKTFGEPEVFDDVALQFQLMEKNALDPDHHLGIRRTVCGQDIDTRKSAGNRLGSTRDGDFGDLRTRNRSY